MNKRVRKPPSRKDDGVTDRTRSYGQTVGDSTDLHDPNSFVDNYTRMGGGGSVEKRTERATMGRSSDRSNNGTSGNRAQTMNSAENLDWRSSPKPEITGLNRERGSMEGGLRNNSHTMRSKNGVSRDTISRSYGSDDDRNWNVESSRHRDADINDLAAKHLNDCVAASLSFKTDSFASRPSNEEFNAKSLMDWHTQRYEAVVRSLKLSSDSKFGHNASDIRYYETKTTSAQPPIAPAKEDILLMLDRAVTQWHICHPTSTKGVVSFDNVANRQASHLRDLSESFKTDSSPVLGIAQAITSPRAHPYVLASDSLPSPAGAPLYSGKLGATLSRSQSNQRVAVSLSNHTVPQSYTGSVLRNDTYSSSPVMHILDNSRSTSSVQTKHSSALLSKQVRNEMPPYQYSSKVGSNSFHGGTVNADSGSEFREGITEASLSRGER